MKNRSNRIFLVLFAVSGSTGLMYEIVWTRLFTPILGNTVSSVSAILTVFMAGLALGSWLAGRVVDGTARPLGRAYAVLEAAIGIYNLLLPFLLRAADPIFRFIYSSAHQSPTALVLTRVAIAFVILILPATLMGATLPVLVRLCTDDVSKAGSQTSRLYAANTLGAAVGAAFAGFLAVPNLGTSSTLRLAAGLNTIVAVTAWICARDEQRLMRPGARHDRLQANSIVLLAMFLSGFAALTDEVAWTRVLGLVVGPTTYAFTLMLCAMIAGLGLGAAFGARWLRTRRLSLTHLAWIEIAIGATALALVPAFGQLPLAIGMLVARYSTSFFAMQGLEFLIFFGLMVLPTFLFGLTFPVGARIYAKSDASLGNEVSAVYAFNTIGGICGSLVAGFVLIPLMGSRVTLIAAACVNVAVCFLLARPRQWVLRGIAAVVVVGALVVPKWNVEMMTSGAYKYAPGVLAHADLETVLSSGDLLYFKEGPAAAVSVRKFRGAVSLSVDGKVDATDAGDMTTQKMLAHLPLLLHRAAKRVAIIGLGSGVTAGAALTHPIEKLDVIEISPEVVDASQFFAHVNGKAFADPRTELIVGDGRNHLRYTNRLYDVIVSEPSNPWMAGMASLFTREFFTEARSRLVADGIHCQWFHSYNMSLDDIRTVVATFRSVFPHAQLWALTRYDLILLGSSSPISVDEEVFRHNFAQVAKDLSGIRVQDPYSILSSLLLTDDELDRFASSGHPPILQTDEFPVLEFRAPLALYSDTTNDNLRALQQASNRIPTSTATATSYQHKAEMLMFAEDLDGAASAFQSALALNGDDVQLLLSAATLYSKRDETTRVTELLDKAHTIDPNNVSVLEKLTDALSDAGSPHLVEMTARLLERSRENPTGLYHRAEIALRQGRFDETADAARRALQQDPKNTRARNVLAIAYERTFQPENAEAEFQRATADASDDWVSYNNYGIFLLERNRIFESLQQFQRAVRINPENLQGFVGISEALLRSGKKSEAEKWRRKADTLNSRITPNTTRN